MGFGQSLRLAREKLHLSIFEASRRTLISSRYIIAIEEENWSELPEDVHVKGYIKSYARLLGLNGDQVWEQAVTSRNPVTQPKSSFLPGKTGSGGNPSRQTGQTTGQDEHEEQSQIEDQQSDLQIEVPDVLRRQADEPSPHSNESLSTEADRSETQYITAKPIRDQQRRNEYQQRLLLVRRRRIIVSVVFWAIMITIAAIILYIALNGGIALFNRGG